MGMVFMAPMLTCLHIWGYVSCMCERSFVLAPFSCHVFGFSVHHALSEGVSIIANIVGSLLCEIKDALQIGVYSLQ
jgi:hypothetical protein